MEMMKATVEITLPDNTIKTIEKSHNDNKVLKDWIYKMMHNPQPILGWIEDGTLAVCTLKQIKQME